MPIKLTAQYYQLTDAGIKDENSAFPAERTFTDSSVTEQQLIIWASYELRELYRLVTRWRIIKISLRRPIFIEVTYKGKLYHFVCQQLLKSELASLGKDEIPILLKNTLFLTRPKHRLRKTATSVSKAISVDKNEQITDLGPILNAIEHRLTNEVKKLSPILYTGMTN